MLCHVDQERFDDPRQGQREVASASGMPRKESPAPVWHLFQKPDKARKSGKRRPPEPDRGLTQRRHRPKGKGKARPTPSR